MPTLRNRIKEHRQVRAGDLVGNEWNPRRHTGQQRRALAQIYDEVGFARSLLAFALPDGRLKLIDGHLRAGLTPDEFVEVEILDVSEEEARVLLLCMDPLAALAEYDDEALSKLRDTAEKDSPAVQLIWSDDDDQEIAEAIAEREADLTEQYYILIECIDEKEQRDLLRRFQLEGLPCQAKMG